MKKAPDKSCIVTIKNTLKNLFIKNINCQSIYAINDAVLRTSKIVFHTYNFLNLYFMHLYHNNQSFPFINENFITTIMLVISKRKDARGRKPNIKTQLLLDKFIIFYNKYYHPLILDEDIVYDDKLKQILLYEATDIVKNINVNISEHYIEYVRRLVNIKFGCKLKIQEITNNINLKEKDKKIKISEICDIYNKVKDDILNPINVTQQEFSSDKKFHKWILENKPFITFWTMFFHFFALRKK
jgi:hypothetical protein